MEDETLDDSLLAAASDGVFEVSLNRPERRNALTIEMVRSLTSLLEDAANDDSVRSILLTAEGDHFCSGFDLDSQPRPDIPPRADATQRLLGPTVNRLIPTMLEIHTPVVVAARGWAAGLGLSLLLAADFAVVATDCRLWTPFTGLGFSADSGTSWLVPRLMGVARAKEMLMLSREVSGADGAEWGAVHRAVPADRVDSEARALAEELAASATVAVGLTKALINRASTTSVEQQLADEAMGVDLSSRSKDFAAAARARRDGTEVRFEGR